MVAHDGRWRPERRHIADPTTGDVMPHMDEPTLLDDPHGYLAATDTRPACLGHPRPRTARTWAVYVQPGPSASLRCEMPLGDL